MTEQAAPDEAPEVPEFCGASREAPNGRSVTCRRPYAHHEDHFDDLAGWGWPNEADDVAGLTQEERVHKRLDALGVPRARMGTADAPPQAFSLVQRHNVFVDRIARRLRDQVDNNMIYYNTIRDVLVLLRGAPHAGSFRIRKAIEQLDGVMPARKSPGGIHLQ